MTEYPLYTRETFNNQQWYVLPSTITTAYTNNLQVWQDWVSTSTTISSAYTWQQWQITPQITYQITQPLPVTAEQLDRHRQEERHLAQVKAARLLQLVLSDEQQAELASHRRFHVRGSRGRRYCIHANGQSGNVTWVDEDGKELGRFCAHPTGHLPDADAWIAQALALQTDEDAFLVVANVHAGVRPSGLIVPVAA